MNEIRMGLRYHLGFFCVVFIRDGAFPFFDPLFSFFIYPFMSSLVDFLAMS